ncbi:hypothetical protein [Mycolicibacterium rutilum]|nr:hypothetical protein [Mycolicibacterium rutilum]
MMNNATDNPALPRTWRDVRLTPAGPRSREYREIDTRVVVRRSATALV